MAAKSMATEKLIIKYITTTLNNFDSTQQSLTWDGWFGQNIRMWFVDIERWLMCV